MKTIRDILSELAAASTDKRDKGDKFERLMKAYFKTDPLYIERFSEVWLWSEWPGNGGIVDTGIDIVCQERNGEGVCAIQCKFFSESHTLQKADIDSFFTASGKHPFTSRIIISTTDRWSSHAEEALDNQQIPTTRIRVQDLDDSAVDWNKFSLDRPEFAVVKPKKVLRPHQVAALDAVRTGFQTHDRGKMIMACGTGKTFTALKIAEEMTPPNGMVLFCVPSISLMSQSLKEWVAEAGRTLRCFAVCSDTKVGKKRENEDMRLHDLAFPATTDAQDLFKQVSRTFKGERLTVIFSTYQ
ncbi:MAG TPA: DEAD/DEAH box helicase family protein, partial [Myxococcota bacterium]|nr:DEAD/DEAH box helicase family protein [Myxococcota bacterium]